MFNASDDFPVIDDRRGCVSAFAGRRRWTMRPFIRYDKSILLEAERSRHCIYLTAGRAADSSCQHPGQLRSPGGLGRMRVRKKRPCLVAAPSDVQTFPNR